MKQKLGDTNAQISKGGRAYSYWLNRGLSPRAVKMVVGGINPDDVDLNKILDKFNLKGFEFGNWLTNNDRYDRVIAAESSLRDLSAIIGTSNIGINRQIGLAFGARGVSSALAHYEPRANMINLTKEKGFGSLAHEYGHALDYNIGSFIDQHKNYPALSGGSSTARQLSDNTGAQFRWYVNKIVDAIKRSESYNKMSLEKRYNDDYWHRRTEIWARFFEQYICWKLKQKKLNNTFLCKSWAIYTSNLPYLSEKEFTPLVKITDAFCGEIAKFLNGKTNALVTKPYPLQIAAEKKGKVPGAKPVTTKSVKTPIIKTSKTIAINDKLKAQMFKIASPKKDWRKKYTGIYFDKRGFIVATDGHKLAAIKCQFPKSMYGKIMDRDGDEIKGERYPDWMAVIPSISNAKETLSVNLKEEIAGLEKIVKRYKEQAQSIKPGKLSKRSEDVIQRAFKFKTLKVNGEKLLSIYKLFSIIGPTCQVSMMPRKKLVMVRNGEHVAILMTII